MARKSRKSIRSKIRECLAQCYQAETPLAGLAEFTEYLREAGWNEADIKAVELTALKVLAKLGKEQVSDEEAGDRPNAG